MVAVKKLFAFQSVFRNEKLPPTSFPINASSFIIVPSLSLSSFIIIIINFGLIISFIFIIIAIIVVVVTDYHQKS